MMEKNSRKEKLVKQLLNKDEFTSYSIFNNINATTGKYDISTLSH